MTAKGGLVRNLSAGEIISQVRDVQQQVAAEGGMPLTNIVFMGMGEPLANYPNVVQALEIITDGDFGLKSPAGGSPYPRRDWSPGWRIWGATPGSTWPSPSMPPMTTPAPG
jgi:hypothetical protein